MSGVLGKRAIGRQRKFGSKKNIFHFGFFDRFFASKAKHFLYVHVGNELNLVLTYYVDMRITYSAKV